MAAVVQEKVLIPEIFFLMVSPSPERLPAPVLRFQMFADNLHGMLVGLTFFALLVTDKKLVTCANITAVHFRIYIYLPY